MNKKRVWKLLEQARKALGLEDSVKLILYPMKYKVASVSLKTKTIRLNKNLLGVFDDETLYYIILHELIHIKTSSLSHGEKFYKNLESLYTIDEIEGIENNIIRKLIERGINTEKWLA